MIFSKLWKERWIIGSKIPSLFHTIYFNFHYLPFKQAIKLPILLYKPHFIALGGSVKINGEIKFGMIRMGRYGIYVYPNDGIYWENRGGTVIFDGKAILGNSTFLSFGKKTSVTFGEDFVATAALKLVSVHGITFGRGARVGWECLIMDTSFHPLYDLNTKQYTKAGGKIEIGDYNWFGTQCKVMHSVKTPERCIFGMNTVVTRNCEKESFCIMGGNPVRILRRNIMRDYNHDREEY